MQLLNKIISKWKGNEYVIDKNIPVAYLLALSFNRILMMVRGAFSFIQHKGYLFVDKGVRIKCRSKLRLGKYVTIGENAFIDALSTEGIHLGDNVSVGKFTRIEATGNLQMLGKGMKVGNNVGLGTDCFYGCAGGIEIGDDTIIGNMVSFHSENHVTEKIKVPIRLQGVKHKGIKISNNCWLGAKVTVLDGVVLGEGCIVAAGAVLKEGVYPSFGIYGGVPAKRLKERND